MRTRATTCALVIAALLVTEGMPSPRAAGGAAADKKEVTLTLRIEDKGTGFKLEAKKVVAKDSSAFDAIRHTVALAYKTDPELGPLVTGLCGVSVPKGTFWALYIDGKLSLEGIGRIKLTKDTVIEWKTEKTEAK